MMRRSLAVLLSGTFLVGCATYKELQPTPPINSIEDGFVGVYDGDKVFLLHKDGRNFIRFPGPRENNTYLILRTPSKSFLNSYLEKGSPAGIGFAGRVPEEEGSNDTLSIYLLSRGDDSYYWVTGEVADDVPLALRYRYTPQWRYTFETKWGSFQDSFARCRTDRSVFESIRPLGDLESINFDTEERNLTENSGRALSLQKQLSDLNQLFPPDIIARGDTAYRQFVTLRDELEKEIEFQKLYKSILDVFQAERLTQGDQEAFLSKAPMFSDFLRHQEGLPERVREKAGQVFTARLDVAASYFEARLLKKNTLEPFESLDPLQDLALACRMEPPENVRQIAGFVREFNRASEALSDFAKEEQATNQAFEQGRDWKSANPFPDLEQRVGRSAPMLPSESALRNERFRRYPSAALLAAAIRNATERVNAAQELYHNGEAILDALHKQEWSRTENGLRALQRRTEWSKFEILASQRDSILHRVDRQMFADVRDASHRRAELFIKGHEQTVKDVAQLYKDSAFVPAYDFRFSVLGAEGIAEKRKTIQQELDILRDKRFAERAIPTLYEEFQKDPSRNGVERARAIVEHGRHYKGDERNVRRLIAECDVNAPKPIVRLKEYRRLYTLPVRDSKNGRYEYVFKLKLNIPSDAQFPVYDVTIKLPQEVAAKAGSTRWYSTLTVDSKPIKNEGRYRITAPTAENDYESLISPVQMDKHKGTIVEVRFQYPESRVFAISTMAQIPIIRKN